MIDVHILALAHRVNSTAANVITNISVPRWDNLTGAWGGYSNTTVTAPDWGIILWQVVNVYPDYVGQLAWILLFLLPFAMMWITHADMTPTAIVGIFFGLYVFAYIGTQYAYTAIVFMAIAFSAILWSMWRGRFS